MRYSLQYQDRCGHELTMTNGVQNITCSTDYVSTLQSTGPLPLTTEMTYESSLHATTTMWSDCAQIHTNAFTKDIFLM